MAVMPCTALYLRQQHATADEVLKATLTTRKS